MPKLPNVKGYANNILKELRQTANSYSTLIDDQDRAKTYPSDSMANKGMGREYYGAKATEDSKKYTAERGQLLGAVLQGRRYDASGKQVKAPTRAVAKKVTPLKKATKK